MCNTHEMVGLVARVGIVGVALLSCGCGSTARVDADRGAAGSSGAASGGSEHGGGSGSGGAAASVGGQGSGRAAPEPCNVVDGKLSYGPIGQAMPWRLTNSSPSADCASCGSVRASFAFRSGAGYGVVWNVVSGQTPIPNLFSMTVGPNFEGGEPRPLSTKQLVSALDIAAGSRGFLVTTCSSDNEPEWLFLNSDLEVADSPKFVAPGSSCRIDAPPVLWTGQGYLTSFTDARGLVIAALDEQGSLVAEKVVSEGGDQPVKARFSKSAERVLFVFKQQSAGQLRYGVLDLLGAPLGEMQAFGGELHATSGFAIAPRSDGWWVLSDSGSAEANTGKLTAFPLDGLAVQEKADFGLLKIEILKPSPYGGTLLIGLRSDGGLHAHSFALMEMIDDAGDVVYSTEKDFSSNGVGSWPVEGVADHQRDFAIEWRRTVEGGERPAVVQEYGCLD